MQKDGTIRTIDKVVVVLFGVFFLSFPLIFSTQTTESFVLPKQVLLAAIVLLALLLFGARLTAAEKIKIRRTPFDFPLAAFTLVGFISAFLSVNRADALTAFVPLLLAALLFFLLNNVVKSASSFHLIVSSFLLGSALLALWTTLSYFTIYPLQIPLTKAQTFSPMGALFDETIYLLIALSLGWYLSISKSSHIKEKTPLQKILFPILTLVVLVGFALSLYQTVSPKNPGDKLLVLPVQTGFQTGLTTISGDSARLIGSLIFGSGYGTFVTDFSRFKSPGINLNQNLWYITFFRSSSFVLEILATMGLLGIMSFLFLIVRILKSAGKTAKGNGLFPAVLLTLILSFIVPFSYNIQVLFFFVLAFYSVYLGLFDAKDFFDVEIDLVAFRKGLLEAVSIDNQSARKANKTLPVTLFLLFVGFAAVVGFFGVRYLMADMLFQKSLVAANQNKGVDTYNYQVNAIQLFPYRDGFYRIYSQTNLALANSIAAAQRPGTAINQQTQQTVYTLIQQAIAAGRSATTVAPLTYFNWENLASIYRSLIGFGQNADTFALASEQQALLLDPNDPQIYINLGGIYYQLGQWDNAQRQFQLAVNLKNDYANAHYNLGHAMEQKGDLQGALLEYQTVQGLVQNNKPNLDKIKGEIAALQSKMGQANRSAGGQSGSTAAQPPLGISRPSTQLPEQHPPVKLPTP